MLVIHPKDKTTDMLRTLYTGCASLLVDSPCPASEIRHILHHTSQSERIMLLGHGCDRGLFYRTDDSSPLFDGIIVGHSHAYYLRKHGANLVGIWCNADLFARNEGLHGLFSGMIISELPEAELYNIATTQEELDIENIKLANRLRQLFNEKVPLSEIPQRMRNLNDTHTPLTDFNYNNFYYL
ncbi:MAG: hypothetical protein ACI4BH_04685 [Muribaculaceae bacterium]